jgi:aminomethyltransferase
MFCGSGSSNMQSAKKLSPVHLKVQESGAQFAEVSGWQVPEVFSSIENETMSAREGVVLADGSASGKILVEGNSAASVFESVMETSSMPISLAIGQGMSTGDHGRLYRLRDDLFFLRTPPGIEAALVQQLSESILSLSAEVSVTDITHGRADLILLGPSSIELLSRLCGLDFHPDRFPKRTAKQSSVAKTRQLILRRDFGDIPAFSLVGARSQAGYLWETIIVAGHDLNIIPIGQATLERLREKANQEL